MAANVVSEPVRERRLLGRGRHGDSWAVRTGGSGAGHTVVLKRLAGLAAAAAEVDLLRERLAGVEAAVVPLGAFALRGDLWVVYPWEEGSAPSEAAQTVGPSLAAAVTAAVDQVHTAGLAHGALSDGNVRVGPTGAVRLLEVGLADLGRRPGASQADDRHDLRTLLGGLGGGGGGNARRPSRSRRARRISVAIPGAVLGLGASVGAAAAIAATVGHDRVPAPAGHPGATGRQITTARQDTTARGDTARGNTARPESRPPADCATGRLEAPAGSVVQSVDITGSGCAQLLAWHDGVVLTDAPDGTPLRFSIGRPGDVLVVGHWRCARAQLPAIYRPSSGQLFYVAAWPEPGRSLTSLPAVDTGVRNGRPVVIGPPACQRVEVEP